VAWGLAALRRRRGVTAGTAWRYSLAEVGLVVGTAPWLWMVFTPRAGARGVNLVPLRDLLAVLHGDPGAAVVQVGGNLLVFAAFGLCAPLRWQALASLPRLFAVAAFGSLLVEIGQYLLDLGRFSSVDDVLVNAAGAALAGLVSRRWWAAPE